MRNHIEKITILMVLLYGSNIVNSIRWNDELCSGDNMMVTFSKCCGNEPYCSTNKQESDCNNGEVGLYCEWVESEENSGKCIPKADDRSDVCCRGGAVKDACHSIAYKMECPKDWLVTKGCCPDENERKYNSILGGIPDDMDCCNSPCTQVEKAISNGATNCTLSSRCAPGPRSYAMSYDPYSTLGFFHQYRHGIPHKFGSIFHGGYGDYDDEYDDEYDEHDEEEHDVKRKKSKHSSHVDEITVDDLFELMIEALEDDTDVKSYDAEYYTDPFLGKTRSGGLLADISLPDPELYFHLLHGTPWGLPHHINLENEFKDPLPIYNFPSPHDYGRPQAPPLGLYDLDSFDRQGVKEGGYYHGYGGSLRKGHGGYGRPRYGHGGYGSPLKNIHGGYGGPLAGIHGGYGSPLGNIYGGYGGSSKASHAGYGHTGSHGGY